MGHILHIRSRLAILAGAVVPLAVAALLVPFRGTFASTAAALMMVIVIVAVAVSGNRMSGVVASASAALGFDFFLTRPYERFAISHRPDLETTIAIFVVGVVVTELAARSRQHWQSANNSTAYVAMIDQVNESLIQLLSLRACRFDRALSHPPLAQIQSNGDVAHVGMRWPAKEIGLPGPEAEILAKWRGRVVGRFVVTPTPGATVSLEQRIVAVAVVDVFAAYLVGEMHAM
jgi:hypothetical protein